MCYERRLEKHKIAPLALLGVQFGLWWIRVNFAKDSISSWYLHHFITPLLTTTGPMAEYIVRCGRGCQPVGDRTANARIKVAGVSLVQRAKQRFRSPVTQLCRTDLLIKSSMSPMKHSKEVRPLLIWKQWNSRKINFLEKGVARLCWHLVSLECGKRKTEPFF